LPVIALFAASALTSCGGGGDGAASVPPVAGACLAAATGDTAIHAPPATGPYAYSPPGSWLPGTAGFPGLGASFVDPVFGTTIRRITAELPNPSSSDIYAQNGWWNADSTLFVQNTGSGRVAIDVMTGNALPNSVPDGTVQILHSFDPVDPDAWYYFENAELRKYSFANDNSSLVHTFGGPVVRLGGSVDWIDRSGQYFLVAFNGQLNVWSRTDGLYTGSIAFDAGTGWAGISPDGKYVVTVTTSAPPPPLTNPVKNLTSYEIDHAARTLSTNGTLFWNLGGDHGDLVSASDGNTYFVTFEYFDEGAVYRVDVTKLQAGTLDQLDRDLQRSSNKKMLSLAGEPNWYDVNGHFSCASKGSNQDWCFLSVESADDSFGSPGSWRAYKQEIIAMQVVPPFAVRRLAHHRSRSVDIYSHQPRVSASWDGQRVAFLSNFGHDANQAPDGYADIYVLDPNCAP